MKEKMKTGVCLGDLDHGRLARAKKAYTTRRVVFDDARVLISGAVAPRAGDLVLARVDKLGHHAKLELRSGRRAQMHPGDEIVVAYGNRYAPDQFEAFVGPDLAPCHLAAAGGVAATVSVRHDRMRKPTRITPLGLLGDGDGAVLNLDQYALAPRATVHALPTIAVVGTAMNAGKTAVAAALVKGLESAGIAVGAAKITGTGAGGDVWQMIDAGASAALDFTDAGYASTYGLGPRQVLAVFSTLVGHLAERGAAIAIVEIADGLFQKETQALLGAPAFSRQIDAIVYAAQDAVGAVAGAQWLTAQGLPLAAISGVVTRAPLAMREIESWTALPVLETRGLADPKVGGRIWRPLVERGLDQRKAEASAEPGLLSPVTIEERLAG